jgi:AcrR family transcriptional regulator
MKNIQLQIPEKGRKETERRLLEAVGSIVRTEGFKNVRINRVAEESGVSKVLIYRYFGDLEGLIGEFIKQKDFWISYPLAKIQIGELASFLKKMFRSQVKEMRENKELAELYRWEITENNQFTKMAEKPREENGLRLIALVRKLTKSRQSEVAAIATILSAAITYLVLFEDYCSEYNGIDLKSQKGWNQILKCVDKLIDLWIESEVK